MGINVVLKTNEFFIKTMENSENCDIMHINSETYRCSVCETKSEENDYESGKGKSV